MVYGIKFKCSDIEYQGFLKDSLQNAFEGLGWGYFNGYGYVVYHIEACPQEEREVTYNQAKAILAHISKFGLRGLKWTMKSF